MNVIKVTNEQRNALFDHNAAAGRVANTPNTETAPRIAWTAKCAALIQMIDPRVKRHGYGILSQLASDLGFALQKYRNVDDTEQLWSHVDDQFQAAQASFDALITAIDIAPH